MATIYGKETFETGSTPWSFDGSVNPYGTISLVADTGSKINSANCLSISCTAETNGQLYVDFGSAYSTIYLQFYVMFPTGWTFPTGGFLTFAGLFTSAQTPGTNDPDVEIKVEDASGVQLVIQGAALPYLATGIIFTLNTVYKVEIKVIKNASTGRVLVWINNNTEGSPDYDSGSQNTGANSVDTLSVGLLYSPATTPAFFIDDIIVGDAFIGSGSTLEQEGFLFRDDNGA